MNNTDENKNFYRKTLNILPIMAAMMLNCRHHDQCMRSHQPADLGRSSSPADIYFVSASLTTSCHWLIVLFTGAALRLWLLQMSLLAAAGWLASWLLVNICFSSGDRINRPILLANHWQFYILLLPVSPFLLLVDCFCQRVLLQVSNCCGCYCLLRPADWPVDCCSNLVFFFCRFCFAIAMTTCCVASAVADDVLSKRGDAMFVDSIIIVNSIVNSIVVGTIDHH